MDKQTAIEKLKAMANEPKDSLKKFLAKEILTHNEPLDFFSLVEKFGMETVYHYEDLDEEVMREFYNTYSPPAAARILSCGYCNKVIFLVQ